MRPKNLISVFQGSTAVEKLGEEVDKHLKILKSHEIRNLHSFCDIMRIYNCKLEQFDGFFVGYSIGQIGKEFDLLRFGEEYVLNIEIKSELKIAKKEEKILKQMQVNYYYLKFLSKPIQIYTYVENDGFYQYIANENTIKKINASYVAKSIFEQTVDYTVDPDKEFVPSNYLISPFNSTEKFMQNEYFLTSAQQKIKEEIQEELFANQFMFFCISANAGTGKTLLMYDIAKEYISADEKVLIIHCGKLNPGHQKLKIIYGWDVKEIKAVNDSFDINKYDYIFIDESQRIRTYQLKILVQKAIERKIPTFFSYDTKQYLRGTESKNIAEYLQRNYSEDKVSVKKLTNKIRTNKELASFINNLTKIGKSKDNLNYECVTIEYFDNMDDLKSYINFLETSEWTSITYTTSQYNKDPYDELSVISDKTAHDVIGQEFSKVVFVMDENFEYNQEGCLTVRQSYYSAFGMLYQIVTRVVDELKIIVLDNPALYVKLLEIKNMGKCK